MMDPIWRLIVGLKDDYSENKNLLCVVVLLFVGMFHQSSVV